MKTKIKTCKCCGRSYDRVQWLRLEHIGEQRFPAEQDLPEIRLELRNCSCGSTLARKAKAA